MTCVSERKAGEVTGGRKKKKRDKDTVSRYPVKRRWGGRRIGGGPTSLCHLPL